MWIIQSLSEDDFDQNDQNRGNALHVSGKVTDKSYVIKSVPIYCTYLSIFPGFWPPIVSAYQIFIIIIVVDYYLRNKDKNRDSIIHYVFIFDIISFATSKQR